MYASNVAERSEIKAEMEVLGPRVEKVLNNNGIYPCAFGASRIFLLET